MRKEKLGEINRPQDKEHNVADEAILEELEERFRVMRHGAPAPGTNVPPVPKAAEIGRTVGGVKRAPAKSPTPRARDNNDSSGIIIAAHTGGVSNSELVSDMPIKTGDICLFSNGEIGVCYQEAQSAPYAVFLMCAPNARMDERGILLDENKPICIGHLADNLFAMMSSTLTWDRDTLVFSLRSVDYIPYIRALDVNKAAPKTVRHESHNSSIVTPPMSPVEKVVAPAPEPRRPMAPPVQQSVRNDFAPPRAPKPLDEDNPMPQSTTSSAATDSPLSKGREISIKNSSKHVWKAVFMGEDEIGHVLAFKTMNGWELTRVNLNDYLDKIDFGPRLSPTQVIEIENDVLRNS